VTLLLPLGAVAALAIPAILLFYFLKVRRPESDFSSTLLWRRAVLDRQASAPWQRLRISRLLLLQLLAAALLVAALVRPALALPGGLGAHTVVILDTSATMQANDVAPSRFEDARRQVREILGRAGGGQRVTLIAMGRSARIVASATGDIAPVSTALEGLHPSNASADLQQALALAASAAGTGAGTRVLLFSDGITLADVEWHVDGRLVDARAVDVDGGAARDLTFSLPAGANRVWASLRGHDALALDDVAYGVATQPRVLKVILVSPANLFVQRALELRPDLRVTTVKPVDYRFDPAVDLYVFDGIVPDRPPATPAWYLNPPEGRFGAGPKGGVGHPRASSADDPLLRDVDLREVHVARSADLRHSTFGGRALLETDSGPLVLVRDEPSRAVLFGFDIHASDLPLRTAFPVLVDHLSSDLLPATIGPRAYHPGEPVLLPASEPGFQTTVTRPDGHVDRLGAGAARGLLAFDDTDQPGYYSVAQRAAGGVATTTFAVSGGGTSSAIDPRTRVELVAGRQAQPGATGSTDFRELWPWLVVAVLLVLTLEWLVFHRGR